MADVLRAIDPHDSLPATLSRVARACVPEVAEMCLVDVMQPDGTIQRVEAIHIDPSKSESIRQLKTRPFAPGSEHPVVEVFQSGRPVLLREVTDDALRRMAVDPAHLFILRRFGPKSLMRLPVVLDGETVAVMAFAMTDSARRLSAADLQFAGEIIGRVVDALERREPT